MDETPTLPFVLVVLIASLISADGRAQENTEQQPSDPATSPTPFYRPVIRKVEGWTVKLDPKLLEPQNQEVGNRAIAALANHLQRVAFVLPVDRVAKLKELPIWMELNGKGRGLVYHPNPKWLKDNGFDPALAKHVHVPSVRHLLDRHQWTKHPYAIMHELAHAYHDQVLGWDDARIKSVFEIAKGSGSYDQVLTHNHKTAKHYGMNNHKEYFAESAEAYLGVNDFYPFVRAELKQHDPRMFRLLEKIWGKIP